MSQLMKLLGALLAGALLSSAAVPSAWAESNVTTPEEFIGGLVDPAARGKRVSGTLSVYYDLNAGSTAGLECETVIWNMAMVATMRHKGTTKSFARDFFDESGTRVPPPYDAIAPFCRDEDARQLEIILAFFKQDVVPFFFPCSPAGECPNFSLKSIRRFDQLGGGAYIVDLTLAVDVGGAAGDGDD